MYHSERVFAYMTPDELRDAARRGLDIQLHTHNHSLDDFAPARIRAEIAENRRILSEILDRPPESFDAFAYPSGDCDATTGATLAEIGVRGATTLELAIAARSVDQRYIPRLVAGEQWSPIELESELAGVGASLRRIRTRARV